MKISPSDSFRVGPADPPADTRKLYAFVILDGVPQVYDFDNTSDGRRELADVVRSGLAVKIVLGHEIMSRQSSVVTLAGEIGFENHALVLGSPHGTQAS